MSPDLPMTDPIQYSSEPEDPPAEEPPVKYGRGKNPNSAKNLQPRKKREPDEPKVTYMKPTKKADTVVWDTSESKPKPKSKKKKIVLVEQDSESSSDEEENYRVVVARRPKKRSASAPPKPKKSVSFKPDPMESISDEDSSTFERQSKTQNPPTPARPVLTFI